MNNNKEIKIDFLIDKKIMTGKKIFRAIPEKSTTIGFIRTSSFDLYGCVKI